MFFYLAYLPLILIILILNLQITWTLLYLTIGALLLGFILFLPLLNSIKSLAPSREKIKIITNNNAEILGFILTYFSPFLVKLTNLNSVIAYFLLLIMIFLIYIETSLFSVNPLLKIIFKYNIYEIKHDEKKYFLLSKNKYSNEDISIKVKRLDMEVLVEDD